MDAWEASTIKDYDLQVTDLYAKLSGASVA